MGVSTSPKLSRDVPLCLKNLKNNFGAWALIEAEILTSPLSHVFGQLGLDLGTGAPPMDQSASPKWSENVPMYLGTFKKIWCMGPL